MTSKIALVTRASGAQGRGVTQHLLQSGWTVHALVSDRDNDRAQALETSGAILFTGTLSDQKSVTTAIQGATALYLTQMPSFLDDSEVREAASLLNLAKNAGVKHVVHGTTLPLNNPNVREKFTSPPFSIVGAAILPKGEVEDLVRRSGITWTILRLGYFMNNFVPPTGYFAELTEGKLVTPFKPDTVLPLVDPEDIGAFAVAAFEDPVKFGGQIITTVSERLGVHDIAAKIGRVNGQTVDVSYMSDEDIEKGMSNPYLVGQLASQGLDELVDMDDVIKWDVKLTSFDNFLHKHRELVVPRAS
ncbi:hypothetical protein B0J11DRAFT_589468 [Dendryphion nanum]|uniref:NmrA-like domain-containing protein n=1 Tax=Dendryphion nanum TaxID=256645 RepID=A0A9P9EM22_9PLEO|nr:hypothetical protein B0J11DRAFT_589468 [Dendryphion nanum]